MQSWYFYNRYLAVFLLQLLFSVSCFASTIELNPIMQGIQTKHQVTFYEDVSQNLSINDILSGSLQSQFKLINNEITSKGISESAWWIKISVHNKHQVEIPWQAEFLMGLTDYITAYQVHNKQLLYSVALGDHAAYINRPSGQNEFPVFSFTTKANTIDEVYFRLMESNGGAIDLLFRIWSEQHLQEYHRLLVLFAGFVLGSLIFLLIHNGVIFFSCREMSYFWYCGYLIIALALFLTVTGIGEHYLWSSSIAVSNNIPTYGLPLLFIMGALFTQSFLKTKQNLPLVNKVLMFIILINILAIIFALADMRVLSLKTTFLANTLTLIYPFIGFYLWKEGYRPALSYAIAWSFWAVFTIFFILRTFGFIPTIESVWLVSRSIFIIEGILLSFVLADRINNLSKEKDQAEKNHTDILDKTNKYLELKVKERTQELEKAKEHATLLANTDVLTSLLNRRAFFVQGEKEIIRAQRYNEPLSVIMIDIDFFKKINDNFGHTAGDFVLQQFAQVVTHHSRNVDICARIGGEEFVILLPKTTLDTAATLAERLCQQISQSEIKYDSKKISITASFGVASLLSNNKLSALIEQADRALYQAKKLGRNQVVSSHKL
jgi:diguanylate cyclase (GGDEF)-like protein